MKVYGKIFMVAAATFVAAACGNVGLTREELRTIDSADSNGIMRVLTVYDRADSLVLRTQCADFAEEDLAAMFTDSLSPCARLASQMVATVTSPEQDGVGIAGPQVGLSRRIVAVQRFDKPGSPFESILTSASSKHGASAALEPKAVYPFRGAVALSRGGTPWSSATPRLPEHSAPRPAMSH